MRTLLPRVMLCLLAALSVAALPTAALAAPAPEAQREPEIRNAVRHAIDPAGIHGPELVEELVDFTLRAKPLLDWGRAIEGRIAKD